MKSARLSSRLSSPTCVYLMRDHSFIYQDAYMSPARSPSCCDMTAAAAAAAAWLHQSPEAAAEGMMASLLEHISTAAADLALAVFEDYITTGSCPGRAIQLQRTSSQQAASSTTHPSSSLAPLPLPPPGPAARPAAGHRHMARTHGFPYCCDAMPGSPSQHGRACMQASAQSNWTSFL